MIKLIVSDLDGTLLAHDKQVHERERTALLQASAAGVELCLASGRLHIEMEHVGQSIGLTPYIVSINGAYVFGPGGKPLYATGFDRELASEVYALGAGFQVGMLACTGELNVTPEANEIVERVNPRLQRPATLMPELPETLRGGGISLCKFSYFGEMAELKRLQAYAETKLGGRVTTYITDVDCLDIMPHGVTKGAGLAMLLKELGLKAEETLCIGDSFNDVSMFELTPHSFAMAGCDPLVRSSARHTAACVADAVAWALEFNAAAAGKTGAR
ncbi:Cof-type HAD-IIB family hydrolase [Paenibacillus chartarius]|uniref:Cof-type HAD-IIB family hydrolase n=1 Tax=Paenibacillus chartarius TaxID=747481 RepID=A0ABV6DJ90_9BACL